MRFYLTLFTLLSFVSIAVFGVFGMDTNDHHYSINSCVGSLTQGTVCPNTGAVDSIVFHLNSFKFFSNSTLAQNISLLLYAFLFLFLSLWVSKKIKPDFSKQVLIDTQKLKMYKIFDSLDLPFKQEKIFWNSLHENSPANFT
ncbi:MAG: hypothetical protein Q8Q95_00495 [bacterium]|nr:hypothetical protein [bacterium]